MEGSEPAPPSDAGSVMKNAERASPATSGARNRSFCAAVPILPIRYMLPSSGAAVFTATGPSGDKPDCFRTVAVSSCVRWPPPARICGVRTPAAQFAHQFLARAVTAATRIAFVWDHHRAHELFHTPGDFARTLCLYNIHAAHAGSPFLAPRNARASSSG